jgi:hypothetical protein
MMTAALWVDVDGDSWVDLVCAYEWGHVMLWRNAGGRAFEDWTLRAGFAAAGTGWWSSLASADFNGDGRPDIVAGNAGLNTPYQASEAQPAVLLADDFRGDDTVQLIETVYDNGLLFPRRSRRELTAMLPALRRLYPTNAAYARATVEDLLGTAALDAAQRYHATELRSGVFLSGADGGYAFTPLPRVAQIAPLQEIVAADLDGDGHADIGALQNSHAPAPAVGRFTGGVGQVLRGDGRGGFVAVAPRESGLIVTGDARALAAIDLDGDGRKELLATRSNGTTQAFRRTGR